MRPVGEALRRRAGIPPALALYIAVESVLAVSLLYEVFEWVLTLATGGSLADAYNGQQGDTWDAQKDMALASLGAVCAVLLLRLRRVKMPTQATGGCACGRIRYRVRTENDDAYLCHCRMCQRTTGGVSIAFKNVAKADVTWEAEPDWYRSSPIARRPYCRECGTPLGFAFLEGENMDLTIGSFDDPSGFRPKHHFGAESMHRAWLDTSALPEYRTDEHQPLVDRWMEAVGKLPE